MGRKIFLLAIIIHFFFFEVANAGSDHGSFLLKILSYNIKGLPRPAGSDYDRFYQIGKILSKRRSLGTQPHVVLLQEAFVGATWNLMTESQYPHVVKGPDRVLGKAVDSGLYILSDLPVIETNQTPFGRFNCDGWDCLANKGAVMARVLIPGTSQPLSIYNTHMQADAKHDAVRIIQVDVINQFLNWTYNPSQPTIFAGDFNFRPSRPSYHYFTSSTSFFSAGEICQTLELGCHSPSTTLPQELLTKSNDQHFFNSDAGKNFTVQPVFAERNFREEVDGRPLSDHLGYEVHYDIRW